MTDDQLQQLMDALSNPWDPLISAGIAILSATLGFVTALLLERQSRKRLKAEAARAARDAAVRDAAAWALRLAGAPGQVWREELVEWSRASGTVLVALSELDEYDVVGGWYLRQVDRLCSPPAAGIWSKAEIVGRVHVAVGVGKRLRAWARGDAHDADFLPEHDAAWDAYLQARMPPETLLP